MTGAYPWVLVLRAGGRGAPKDSPDNRGSSLVPTPPDVGQLRGRRVGGLALGGWEWLENGQGALPSCRRRLPRGSYDGKEQSALL